MTPLFKKADTFDKVNYRLVTYCHMFQKPMRQLFSIKSIHTLNHTFLVSLLVSPQHSLLKMLELWKEALDKGKSVGAIFMDLSKAFDTLNHDLLITKLEAYGFSKNYLNYI